MISAIVQFVRRYKTALVMGGVVVLYLIGSLVLVNGSGLYISPDETAAAHFVHRVSKTGLPSGPYSELAILLEDRVYPRSMVSVNGELLPGSFLGLPMLYGVVVALVDSWVMWILTPLLTVLAAFGLYRLVSRWRPGSVALLSAGLFLLHPAVWYYSARGLMHNVLFIDLLLIALWLFVVRPMKGILLNDILVGLLVVLAVMTRTSEVMWLGAAVVVLCVAYWRSFSWQRVGSLLAGGIIGLMLLFGMNTLVFGWPLTTGYTVGQIDTQSLDLAAGDALDAVEVLPFGFHPRNAWTHFLAYGAGMFWWLSLLAVIGLVLLVRSVSWKRWVAPVGVGLALSVWLVLMYGSWEIHDNPDPTVITMANSYVRYWLPMYVLSIPLIALVISKVRVGWIRYVLMIGLLCLNVYAVFFQGQDGLLSVRETLVRSEEIQLSVLAHVPGDGLVIVDRADKLFFPWREVMYPLRTDETYDAMPVVIDQGVPLYYYGITFPEEDFTYLHESRLKRMGLGIELVETYDEESLYRIFARETLLDGSE